MNVRSARGGMCWNQRRALGILAVLLLTVGPGAWLAGPAHAEAPQGTDAASQPPAPSTVWDKIQTAMNAVYGFIWPMAVTLAGVGTATMAGFQMVKDLFHVRRWFNRRAVGEWLSGRATEVAREWARTHTPGVRDARPDAGELAREARASLEGLATAGAADALYSLEIDKLAGQINAAARMALDLPKNHKSLLRCLAAQAEPTDLDRILEPPVLPARTEPEKQKVTDYLEAKNRIATYIQRTLDGFQIMADYRWTHWNQTWVFWINFAFVLLLWAVYARLGGRVAIGAVAITALLGGFVAPVAKDLVSALQSLKGRR